MRAKFLFQPLNEAFSKNPQFPRGLNLAKIAFLTLLGLNSNRPPLLLQNQVTLPPHAPPEDLSPWGRGAGGCRSERDSRGRWGRGGGGGPGEEASLHSVEPHSNPMSGDQRVPIAPEGSGTSWGLCLPSLWVSVSQGCVGGGGATEPDGHAQPTCRSQAGQAICSRPTRQPRAGRGNGQEPQDPQAAGRKPEPIHQTLPLLLPPPPAPPRLAVFRFRGVWTGRRD